MSRPPLSTDRAATSSKSSAPHLTFGRGQVPCSFRRALSIRFARSESAGPKLNATPSSAVHFKCSPAGLSFAKRYNVITRSVSSRAVITLCIAPLALLLAALSVLSQCHFGNLSYETYLKCLKFWGGNPSEVYSHWLDMVLMSGNAIALAWWLTLEAYCRPRSDLSWALGLTSLSRKLCVAVTGVFAVILDISHGEGTVLLVYPVYFLPLLGASYYLLRQFASHLQWRFRPVLMLSAVYAITHTAVQLFYEPSGSGGPNDRIIPIWFLTVGAALLWALVRGIRTGWLRRFFINFGQAVRKPPVWGTAIVVAVPLAIAATIQANRLHTPRNQIALPWLNELETKLSDPFVAELKRDHVQPGTAEYSKIALSQKASALFDDPRIKAGYSVRLFVPVTETNYLFLWGNGTFQYCDVRPLGSQIDQEFIDELCVQGGTRETSFYSVLWSPYRAGRLLKDANGKTKAICLISSDQ